MMKLRKLFSMVAAVFCMATVAAQTTYLPVLSEGKSWSVDKANDETEVYVVRDIEVVGDTIVNDRVCKKLLTSRRQKDFTIAVAYEQDGKLWDVVDGTFNLLFDMNWKVGDQVGDGVVLAKDVITVNGIPRKRLMIDSGTDDPYLDHIYYVVEGIGLSTDYYLNKGLLEYSGYRFYMLSCSENGKVIFTANDFTQEQSGISDITADKQDHTLYDLNGRRVTIPAQPGIYIHQGKKVVIK